MDGRRAGEAWVRRTVMGLAIALAAPSAFATAAEEPRPAQGHYEAPPPIRIFRFSAYSTMKARWRKKATVDTLVLTTEGGVLTGDRGQLQRQVKAPRTESGARPVSWVPFANVTVKKVLPKGRLELEIESETPEARIKRDGKLPFNPGQKVLLQIDRVLD